MRDIPIWSAFFYLTNNPFSFRHMIIVILPLTEIGKCVVGFRQIQDVNLCPKKIQKTQDPANM